MNNIIIESGATTSDWRICSDNTVEQFFLEGTNVSAMSIGSVEAILAKGLEKTGLKSVDGVYLYTAGVCTTRIVRELSEFIADRISACTIEIQDDMVAAARAACGHYPGIVAILGTGSNSCYYDGTDLHHKVYSGGFIIGDNGSASVLGKMFLSDYIKNNVPEIMAKAFSEQFDSSYSAIVENVYRSAAPSKYLGSIAPFVTSFYDTEEYARRLVELNFIRFIEDSLWPYDTRNMAVGVIGGFGYSMQDVFRRLCTERGVTVSKFVKAPIYELIAFHNGRIK